jgi:hypothetical protein
VATVPEFGERYENTVASPSNPLRFGRFVRVVTIPRGRTNAGRWWEMTDGKGEFWFMNPEHCRPALIDGDG